MVGLGMLYIPLKDVVGMLSWQYFVVVVCRFHCYCYRIFRFTLHEYESR